MRGTQAVEPREQRLARDRLAPAAARRFVAARLGGQPEALRERAVLAASELVTNVVRHADPRCESIGLRVASDEVVRIEVSQRTPPFAARRRPPGDSRPGWGLHIVATVADRWGIDERPGETTVWLELDPQ